MGLGRYALGTMLAAFALAGCGAHFHVSLGSKTLSNPEGDVANALASGTGVRPKKVLCPSDIPVKTGHQFRCTLTAPDGTRFGATITERSVSGDRVGMHVQVDTKPLPG